MIFILYHHVDLFFPFPPPFNRVRLRSASMFTYIIYSIIMFECVGVVFISSKTHTVWSSLSASRSHKT